MCQPQSRSPIVGSPCVGECALPKSAGEPSPHLCGGLASCAQSDTPTDPAVSPSAHMPVAGGGQSHGQPPLLDVVVPEPGPKPKPEFEPTDRHIRASGATSNLSPSELNADIVADTGANKMVIGASHNSCVENERELDSPMILATANSELELCKEGDLPHSLCVDGLVNPSSSMTLLPVVPTCERFDLEFHVQVDKGGVGARFHDGDHVVLECAIRNGLPVFTLGDSGCVPEFPGSVGASMMLARAMSASVEIWARSLVASSVRSEMPSSESRGCPTSVGSEIPSGSEYRGCQLKDSELKCTCCASSAPGWMLEHDLDGHRPNRGDCPYCVQAGLRERKATRIVDPPTRDPLKLRLAGDFSGPHEPGVTGAKQALVLVECTHGYGYVGLQASRSASESLESLKEFERELKSLGLEGSRVVSYHHDDDTSFKGSFYEYVRESGWVDTHTGGYRPNSNSMCERRVGLLHQTFRTILLRATGGVLYYDMLWGVGLKYSNELLNRSEWPTRETPIVSLSGSLPSDVDRHVFGSYCLFKIPHELVEGKWSPRSEMGIWVGVDRSASHSHLVCPIVWMVDTQSWDIKPPISATRVKVYDTVFPLRMSPRSREFGSQEFDTFVESTPSPTLFTHDSPEYQVVDSSLGDEFPVVETKSLDTETPILRRSERLAKRSSEDVGLESDDRPSPHTLSRPETHYEIDKIVKRRVWRGQPQYLVKFKGWPHKHNVWRGIDDLSCDEVIQNYELAHGKALGAMTPIDMTCIALSQAQDLFGENDCNARIAVESIMRRQKLSDEHTVDSFLQGYKNEIVHMLTRRLRLLGPSESNSVRRESNLGKLRMLLELKRDGRKKARLILQGFREPKEWDEGSVSSPVVFPSSIRSFLFSAGDRDECISVNDVSVAFLQADPFPLDQPSRYVSYKPHRHSEDYLFEMLGTIYGARSASREWFLTFAKWLVEGLGLVQGKNEPCLSTHPSSGLKVLLYVDDCIVRASKSVSLAFHEALEARFDCRPESRQFLTPTHPIEFTGVRLTMEQGDKVDSYYIDQNEAIAKFLIEHNLDSAPLVDSPMPSKHELTGDSSPCESESESWCKSVNGSLHYFVRASRWDI